MCTTRTAGNSADGDMADKLQVGTAKPEAGMPKSAVSASTKEMEGRYTISSKGWRHAMTLLTC